MKSAPSHRRRRMASILCASLVLVPILRFAGRLPAQRSDEYHHRADQALQAFLLNYWSQGKEYLNAKYPDDGTSTGYWTFAQGFDALLDGVERSQGMAYSGLIETFHDAQDQRGWIVGYYDDESWMALALIRAFDLTGDSRYLTRASALFADIEGGWDTTCCGSPKGGIWWDKPHTQKATASNAGPVIVGARLFERLGTVPDLDFAKKVYDFWLANMVNTSTHQVTDHIQPDGTRVFWKFSYNEGLMIGASVELHRVTGEAKYLTNAKNIASFLTSSEVRSTAYGSVLDDGTNTSCTGDCAMFKGPAARYLRLLYEATGTASYRKVLKSSADAIWNLARSSTGPHFSVSWAGPPMSSFIEPQDAAAVMALSLHADLEGIYPGTGRPGNQYEAEEAAIRGVGLEADHAGFTGWGYVAGWNGDGQRVVFKVRVPSQGTYEVIFRYAAGAGDASRLIRVDDAIAELNFGFPGTGGWGNYDTQSFFRAFPQGTSTISVDFDGQHGSSNFLNLDHLRLRGLESMFYRGDANGDGGLDVSDAVAIAVHLFAGRTNAVECSAAADADSNGSVNLSDVLYILGFLFTLGPAPAAPFPACGPDTTQGRLGCDVGSSCR